VFFGDFFARAKKLPAPESGTLPPFDYFSHDGKVTRPVGETEGFQGHALDFVNFCDKI
jgi:hypothetical protein